jgi:hypothetical protein
VRPDDYDPSMTEGTGTAPDTDPQDRQAACHGELISKQYAGPGEWLPAGPAAVRLGISERTLWRRVDAGVIAKRSGDGRAEMYVPLLDVDLSGAAPDPSGRLPVARPEPLALAIVGELERQHTVMLAREERLLERIRLQAETIGRLEAELARHRPARPWWAFWRAVRPGSSSSSEAP